MLSLLLACTPAPEETTPWFPPDQAGPFAVATEEDQISSREGVPLAIQLWFPATTHDDDLHKYDDFWAAPTAYDGGTPSCETTFPVVVFSHGHTGMRWQSYFLTEYLASHGFLVVAPDHTYNTVFDIDESKTGEVALRRPWDVADSFDYAVARSKDPADPLYGCIDPEAGYFLAGHSFGGYTSLATGGAAVDVAASRAWCAENGGWLCGWSEEYAATYGEDAVINHSDSRVRAILPMAPAGREVLIGGLPDIDIPTMIISGDMDESVDWDAEVKPIFDDITLPTRKLGQFVGAGHMTFSNACQIVPTYDGCNPPLSDEDAHPVINTLATAWFRGLLGDTEAMDYFPYDSSFVVWEEYP